MVISISNDRDQFYIHHISYTFVSIYSYTYTHMTQHLQPIKPHPSPSTTLCAVKIAATRSMYHELAIK